MLLRNSCLRPSEMGELDPVSKWMKSYLFRLSCFLPIECLTFILTVHFYMIDLHCVDTIKKKNETIMEVFSTLGTLKLVLQNQWPESAHGWLENWFFRRLSHWLYTLPKDCISADIFPHVFMKKQGTVLHYFAYLLWWSDEVIDSLKVLNQFLISSKFFFPSMEGEKIMKTYCLNSLSFFLSLKKQISFMLY